MFRKPDGAGKGDAPRPTDWDKFSESFDRIFGKKEEHCCNQDCNQGRTCPLRKKKNEQPSETPQVQDNDRDNAKG